MVRRTGYATASSQGALFEVPMDGVVASKPQRESKALGSETKKARRVTALAAEVPQRDDRDISVTELVREIEGLETQIASTVRRIRQLKVLWKTRKAAVESLRMRRENSEQKKAVVVQAFIRLGSGRDAAPKVAQETNIPLRTVYRYLKEEKT